MLNRMEARKVSSAISIGAPPHGVRLRLTDQSENKKEEMQRFQRGPQRDQETPSRLLRSVIPATVEAVLSLDRTVYMTFAAHDESSIARWKPLKAWGSVCPARKLQPGLR